MSELRTIIAPFHKVGVYTIRDDGDELPKQAPAIVSPGAVKRVTRARGEENQIPQVEIYIDDQGLAGQEAAPERIVSKAMREAKRRVGSRKEIADIEKEILQKKVEKKIKGEEILEEVEKGVVKKKIKDKPVLAIEDKPVLAIEDAGVEKAKLKLEKAKVKEKRAKAEAFTEAIRAQTYLQFMNARAKELQKKDGVSFVEGRRIATTEWKESHPKNVAGYITEKGEESMSSKKSSKSKSDGTIPDMKISEKPKKVYKIKLTEETKKKLEEEKKAKLAEEDKKAKEMQLKASEESKVKKQSKLTQRQIVSFIESLDDAELEEEYRKIHPRKAFPSRVKMQNALIKDAGGRIIGGKKKYGTSEEESSD